MINEVQVWPYWQLYNALLAKAGLGEHDNATVDATWKAGYPGNLPQDELFISIRCPDEVDNLPFPSETPRVLRLRFFDADPAREVQCFERKTRAEMEVFQHPYFDQSDVDKVYDFLNGWNFVQEDYKLNVHCAAGISRSGAIGTFATEYLGLNQEDFRNKHPWIRPNSHILALLHRKLWGV